MQTQGKWHHETELDAPSRRQVSAFSSDGNRVLQIVVHSFNPDEDARLIAAAPDLLAALEDMIANACVAAEVMPDGTHRVDATEAEWDAHVAATNRACAAINLARSSQVERAR